jgi:hypothetical protein
MGGLHARLLSWGWGTAGAVARWGAAAAVGGVRRARGGLATWPKRGENGGEGREWPGGPGRESMALGRAAERAGAEGESHWAARARLVEQARRSGPRRG